MLVSHMMTILVTGAAGWIGSHLVRRLASGGNRVIGIVRPGGDRWRLSGVSGVEILECDLSDRIQVAEAIAVARPDICYHLAWSVTPGEYLRANENLACLQFSINLADRLAASGCRRFVGVGTCLEYDPGPGVLSEGMALRPASLYAASKLAFRLVLEQICSQHGMAFSWVRLFHQYGPAEHPARLVPYVITSVLQGKEVYLSLGTQKRDYLHVADVASAIEAIGRQGIDGDVNVGSSQAVAVAELARRIAEFAGRTELLRPGAKPLDPREPPVICASVERLRALGWRPSYTLEEGLKETFRWWAERARQGIQ